MYKPKEGEQFFFMHIPKTGGTTLRRLLANHFPDGSYYPTQEDLFANGGKYFKQKDLIMKKQILQKSLIMGHYNVDLIKHLKPNVKVFTIIRNPKHRILSHLKHILKHDVEFKDENANEVINKRINMITNVQLKYMGYKSNLDNFNTAVNNSKRIDFIGILDFFRESILRLNESFKWNLDYNGDIENEIIKNIREELTDESINTINSILIKELSLYKICLTDFNTFKAQNSNSTYHKN